MCCGQKSFSHQWTATKVYRMHLSFRRFISEEGLKKINDNGLVSDVKGLIKRALDVSISYIDCRQYRAITLVDHKNGCFHDRHVH